MARLVWSMTMAAIVLGVLSSEIRADEDRSATVALPHWIWCRDTCGDVGLAPGEARECRIERHFALKRPAQSATLRMAADFCSARVQINGKNVLALEPYSPTTEIDVTAALLAGENQITVSATACGGPAAVAVSLSLVDAEGKRTTLVSNGQWTCLAAGSDAGRVPAISMGVVTPALWGIGRRLATIDPFDNYEQWRQAAGTSAAATQASFWTAPGFEISLIRSALPEEGSWVSMAFDPQGRITIAREDQGLLRMTLTPPGDSIAKVEAIDDKLLECRGLLYAHDALYANANNSKGLYRLRDTDGDDRFDEVKLLREFPGGVGHGRNDLALGPDGSVYLIHGDSVNVPRDDVLDRTSPFREARRGRQTSEGHVLRTDKDGKQWELVCGGLRNPFGIAFNPLGDLFTYDADAEFDMGTPWYRPTRIVQLVSGADYGWRGVTGKWPPYFPDHADNGLPTLDIGKGSPTAVAFGTGTRFPADYRDALFVLDWAYGRIVAVHLSPRGAGYRAQAETFLKGRPLNVTDLAVGPDGAMYLVTGGRKTQSALYRIAFTGDDLSSQPPSPHERACQIHASAARDMRLQLEKHHQPADASAIAVLWPQLGSPDPTLRHAARIALEHQPQQTWQEQALAEKQTTAALTALLALFRAEDKSAAATIIDRLVAFDVKKLGVGQLLALVQCYELCRQQAPEAVAARQVKLIAQLDAVFPHPAGEWKHVSPYGSGAALQRDLARLFSELDSPSLVQKTAKTLLVSSAQEDRLLALFVLRHAKRGWTPQARRAYFAVLAEGSTFVSGEGMPRFLAQLREESLKTLSEAERKELADLLDDPSEPADETPPPVRPLVKKWTLAELAPLVAKTSGGGNAERGAVHFRDALCIRCHRVGARGPAVGPDLTHVAGRFSRSDILQSILEPSSVVAENYRNLQVRTTDGRVLVGRVLAEGDYRSEKLRLSTEPLRPSVVVELSKREIDDYRQTDSSPMPQGLLDTFTAQEVLDLLAYLERGTVAEHSRP